MTAVREVRFDSCIYTSTEVGFFTPHLEAAVTPETLRIDSHKHWRPASPFRLIHQKRCRNINKHKRCRRPQYRGSGPQRAREGALLVYCILALDIPGN
ncbi:hypothetical protein E2C01_079348 [Portunus trituberculatus]|uniref:Uncharacterized protein n=1 Tax=Portunus trituberculatus TaxID=210409 RepID=A0A5B7IQ27_PORTR|nr:hypothetical protein [Portunus trituberculatus]